MAARGQPEKLKKNILSIFFKFYITFLARWGCAIDFLKMLPLPKFKMAARGQLQKHCAHENSKKNSEIIQILQSHSSRYGDVLVIFSRSTEIQNGRHGSTSYFFVAQILKNWSHK